MMIQEMQDIVDTINRDWGRNMRVEQRYVDRAKTRPMPDTFNIFKGRSFVRTLYRVGDDWQWGGLQHERSADVNVALRNLIRFWF